MFENDKIQNLHYLHISLCGSCQKKRITGILIRSLKGNPFIQHPKCHAKCKKSPKCEDIQNVRSPTPGNHFEQVREQNEATALKFLFFWKTNVFIISKSHFPLYSPKISEPPPWFTYFWWIQRKIQHKSQLSRFEDDTD